MVMKIASVFVVVVVVVAARAVYGADIVVGGNSGWDLGFNYDTWVAGQSFKIADTLVFNYGGSHSVAEVNEENYKACSSSRVIGSVHTGGSTSIPLTAAGPRYFVCTTAGHCAGGMKLQVNVVAANAPPTTPPATPNTPPTTPPSTPNTPPTTPPSTPNTPPTPMSPPSPSAASTLSFFNLNHLFLGPFFAAALFAL